MLGLSNNLSSPGIVTPGIVTSSLVLKHNYAAGGVSLVSDGAALFNGTADYIDCGGDIDETGAFTISAWFNTDSISGLRTIACQGNSFFGLNGAYPFYQGQASSDNDLDGQTALVVGKWYHIALTVAGTSAADGKIYINGVRDDDNATTVFMVAGDFVIGKNPTASDRYWDGYLCNVGLWSGVLTQPQIKSIMWKNYAGLTDSDKDAGTTGSSNLVSWWNLDEETATDGTAGSGGVKDSHGSNHGDLE